MSRGSPDHEFDLAGAAHGAQLRRVAGAANLISIQFQLVGESKVHVLVAVEKRHNRVVIRGGASALDMERVRRRDAVIGGADRPGGVLQHPVPPLDMSNGADEIATPPDRRFRANSAPGLSQ